jgi:hypothetical protein
MIPEWMREEIYNLQQRVEKLETGNLVEDVRMQTARKCAEIVLNRRDAYKNNEFAALTDAAVAILQHYGVEGQNG